MIVSSHIKFEWAKVACSFPLSVPFLFLLLCFFSVSSALSIPGFDILQTLLFTVER